MKTRLSLFVGLFVVCFGFSQTKGYWTKNAQKFSTKNISSIGADVNTTNKTIYRLDADGIRKALTASPQRAKSSGNSDVVISFPNSDGQFEQYRMTQTSVLHPDLAKRYPSIKSYVGKNVNGDGSQVHLSLGDDGLHATFFKPGSSTQYIDPYTANRKNYIVYGKADMGTREAFKCSLQEIGPKNKAPNYDDMQQRNPNDGTLRTYRLAMAATGEYSQFHIQDQGVSSGASDAVKKAAVLSAINTTMTRVNGIYERDLGVTMQVVANNDKIIYLNASSDPYSNEYLRKNNEVCDREIGSANYDIGHVVSTGSGGVAYLGVVCRNGSKAGGTTGLRTPKGDPFDVDYVAHEMGHQFGGNHTMNNACGGNRNSGTAVEPGSASTIMGYAGICSPNVQNKSDDHFHAISIQEMWAHVLSGSCAQKTVTGNNAPTANAGSNFTIPKSTPFVLKGSGTDTNSEDKLTYNWEQMDKELVTMPPRATNTGGPAFRSISSKTSPDRYMPDLATVIAGNTASEWEVVPSVARTMNFRLTVRDNHVGGGNTASDDTRITVSAAAGPFIVNAPNTAVSWAAGSSQTVTWSVAGTTGNGVNAANVDILLSTDGGKTYPVTIASAVANDGSHEITVPNNRGSQNRIMVRGTNHIFYDISNANFTITGGIVDNEAPSTPSNLTASNETQTTIDLSWTASTDNVGVTGYDVYQGNTMITTVTGTRYQATGLTAGTEYSFRVKAKDAAGNESAFSNTATASTLPEEDTQAPTAPSRLAAANETQTTIDLTWEASTDNVGVTGYDVYRGNTMIATVAGTRYQATGLTAGTEYSFRVKAKDAAGNESAFSNTATASTLPEDNTDTEAPTVPSRLAAANETQTTIDLTWEPSTDNVAVTGYDVYQGDTMIATVPGTRYQAAGLTAGTEYSFRVKAKDAAGNESVFSNTATASTLPEDNTDTEAPTVPSRLAAANETQTTIDLTWEASTDNVAVTGYDVYQGDTMVATVPGTRYQAAGLTPGTEYSFRVKAKDAAGNESAFSNTATASTLPEDNTDTEAPTVPSRLAAANETQTTIDLTWEASTDNVAVTGYDVYQGDTMVATVPGTRYQAAGLTPGTEYSFRVKAKDAAGNESAFSNTATASTLPEDNTDTEAPTAPTELMADNETQTTIDLSWMASTDNVGVTGYEVYQGDVMIATVEGTRYQVMGLTPGTEYSFSVLAMDAAGNKSRFSNTATASTLPEDNTDTEAPTVPTELAASNIKQTTLTLNWMASTDNVAVTGYNVYQGTTMIGTSVTTSFNVSGLTAATTYQFTVVAMDAAGNMSEASNVATATTKDEDTTNICEGVAPWQWGVPYQTGDRVVYRGNLFEKLERGWKFIGRCNASSCEGIDEWKSGTSYNSGDKIVYKGNLWQRTDRGWVFVSSCGAKSSSKIAPPSGGITISPNPANNLININNYTPSEERAVYSVIDLLGRTINSGDYKSATLDVSNLKAGTYILRITTSNAVRTATFIKE